MTNLPTTSPANDKGTGRRAVARGLITKAGDRRITTQVTTETNGFRGSVRTVATSGGAR